eukprot:7377376-Prymnesium_polylepis.1
MQRCSTGAMFATGAVARVVDASARTVRTAAVPRRAASAPAEESPRGRISGCAVSAVAARAMTLRSQGEPCPAARPTAATRPSHGRARQTAGRRD